jgi:hypothetical protein
MRKMLVLRDSPSPPLQYGSHCFRKLEKVKRDFNSLPPHQRALVPGMEAKLEALRTCVGTNQVPHFCFVTRATSEFSKVVFCAQHSQFQCLLTQYILLPSA